MAKKHMTSEELSQTIEKLDEERKALKREYNAALRTEKSEQEKRDAYALFGWAKETEIAVDNEYGQKEHITVYDYWKKMMSV